MVTWFFCVLYCLIIQFTSNARLSSGVLCQCFWGARDQVLSDATPKCGDTFPQHVLSGCVTNESVQPLTGGRRLSQSSAWALAQPCCWVARGSPRRGRGCWGTGRVAGGTEWAALCAPPSPGTAAHSSRPWSWGAGDRTDG